uniref:Uncharacterized protein n=1 Tax=Glossina brevipalpis TaxID=37001 RepID=A0A1A9WJW0_9MUSC
MSSILQTIYKLMHIYLKSFENYPQYVHRLFQAYLSTAYLIWLAALIACMQIALYATEEGCHRNAYVYFARPHFRDLNTFQICHSLREEIKRNLIIIRHICDNLTFQIQLTPIHHIFNVSELTRLFDINLVVVNETLGKSFMLKEKFDDWLASNLLNRMISVTLQKSGKGPNLVKFLGFELLKMTCCEESAGTGTTPRTSQNSGGMQTAYKLLSDGSAAMELAVFISGPEVVQSTITLSSPKYLLAIFSFFTGQVQSRHIREIAVLAYILYVFFLNQ